jgi:hypothetical protein
MTGFDRCDSPADHDRRSDGDSDRMAGSEVVSVIGGVFNGGAASEQHQEGKQEDTGGHVRSPLR